MPKKTITSYDHIRKTLRTFDILNCLPYVRHWWNPLHWIMRLIGHTAMIYVCKETGQIMVYESTQTSRSDGKSGVQLRPLREFIKQYPGRIKLRQTFISSVFRTGSSAEVRQEAERLFTVHIKKYRGTKYPNLKKWKFSKGTI